MPNPFCPLPDPRQNQLLAQLPEDDWARWQAALEPVELALGQVLGESGRTPDWAYFPTTAVVSLLYLTRDGGSSEYAVVGRDGVVGISLVMGGNTTPGQSVVHSAGQGYRLRARLLRDELDRAGPVLMLLLRYTQTLMDQVAQTAACIRYQSIDQLLCRRLLLGLERLPAGDMMMTQELLANLLGVRREGVTAAAHRLQQAGIICYRRGHIAVLDRQRLLMRSGESPTQARRHCRPGPMALAA